MLFYILVVAVLFAQATEIENDTCERYSQTDCASQAGCVWSEFECTETEAEAGEVEEVEGECEHPDQNSCVSAGCTWFIDEEGVGECEQTELECDLHLTQAACGAQTGCRWEVELDGEGECIEEEAEAEAEEVDPEGADVECDLQTTQGACAETTGCAWEAEEQECVSSTDIEAAGAQGAESEAEVEHAECELLSESACGTTSGCTWYAGEGCEETEVTLSKTHVVVTECDGLQEADCNSNAACQWELEAELGENEGECIEVSDAEPTEIDATDIPEVELDPTDANECDASETACQACGGVWTQDLEEPTEWECERNDAGEGIDCDASEANCQQCGGTWSIETEADGETEGDCSGVVDNQETETDVETPEAPEQPEAPEAPEEPSLSKPHQTSECGDLLEAACASDSNCSWEIEADGEGECISNSDVEAAEPTEIDELEPTEVPEAGEQIECDASESACSGCGGTWITDNEGESDCEVPEVGNPDCDLDQAHCSACGGTWVTDVEGEADCEGLEGEAVENETEAGELNDEIEAGSCEGLDQTTCGSTTGCAWITDGLKSECEGEGTEPTLKKMNPDGTHFSRDVDNYLLAVLAFFGSAAFAGWAVHKVMKRREQTDIIDLDSFSSHSEAYNYEAFV